MGWWVAAGIALVLIAYVMGSVPFAIVIGKWFWHVDVRDHGSGNVGTTNVFRVLGIRAGSLVLIGDMAKGFIPVFIAAHYFPTWYALIVALAALLGHMYSVFLRGGGGKGVATGAGIVLALVPWIFIIALCVFLVFLFTTRMVSVASMMAALTSPSARSPSTSRSGTRSSRSSPPSSSSFSIAPTCAASRYAARTR